MICRAHAILANYAVGRDSVKERTDRMFFGDRMKTLAPPWPGLDVIKRKVPAQAGVSFCHVSRNRMWAPFISPVGHDAT